MIFLLFEKNIANRLFFLHYTPPWQPNFASQLREIDIFSLAFFYATKRADNKVQREKRNDCILNVTGHTFGLYHLSNGNDNSIDKWKHISFTGFISKSLAGICILSHSIFVTPSFVHSAWNLFHPRPIFPPCTISINWIFLLPLKSSKKLSILLIFPPVCASTDDEDNFQMKKKMVDAHLPYLSLMKGFYNKWKGVSITALMSLP